ncbi:hypothetical protein GYH30_052542 [Glycine max]|nr:hypothetical protein GYH30_052542 [Glycine max]
MSSFKKIHSFVDCSKKTTHSPTRTSTLSPPSPALTSSPPTSFFPTISNSTNSSTSTASTSPSLGKTPTLWFTSGGSTSKAASFSPLKNNHNKSPIPNPNPIHKDQKQYKDNKEQISAEPFAGRQNVWF